MRSLSVSVQAHLCENIPAGQNRVRSAMAISHLTPWLLSLKANILLAVYVSLWVFPNKNLTSFSADRDNKTHSSCLIVNHSPSLYSVWPQWSPDPVSFTRSPFSLLIWIRMPASKSPVYFPPHPCWYFSASVLWAVMNTHLGIVETALAKAFILVSY